MRGDRGLREGSVDATAEVASPDGTTIRWARHGMGPSLVFVHGGLSGIGDYTELSLALGTAVSVFALGRRGYGFSDDGPAYSYHAEAEDILAVVSAAHPASWAIGHSSGAICTLLAARAGTLDKVILYEPPLPLGVPVLATDRRRAAEMAVARGDADEAITIGLVDGVKLSAEVVASLRADPQWEDLRPLASPWIREFAEIDARRCLATGIADAFCVPWTATHAAHAASHPADRQLVGRLGDD